MDNTVSVEDNISLDKKIKNLVREKEKIEKKDSSSLILDPITKEDLEKLNFSDDLSKLKAIQREHILEDLSSLLNHKIKELEQKEKDSKQKEDLDKDFNEMLEYATGKEAFKTYSNARARLEGKQKEQVLSDLTIALDTKIYHLKLANTQLQTEKKHSEELNQSLKTTLKKLSDAEMQLKIERDWLAEQVEKKSMEVLKTIDQLIKAENAKSTTS